MECLRFLVQICQELGLPYETYNAEYMRLKRKQEAEDAKFSDFQNVGDDYMNGAMGQVQGGPGHGGQMGGFDPPPMMTGVEMGNPSRDDGQRVVQRQPQNQGTQDQDENWGGGDDDLLPD